MIELTLNYSIHTPLIQSFHNYIFQEVTKKWCCVFYHLFLSRIVFDFPTSVDHLTHVINSYRIAIIFDHCNYVHRLVTSSTIWPGNPWNIHGVFKYQDIIKFAWFDSLDTRFCDISANLWWNLMVIDGLVVVSDTVFRIFIHELIGK